MEGFDSEPWTQKMIYRFRSEMEVKFGPETKKSNNAWFKIGGDVSCVPSKKKQLSLKNREVKLSPYLRIKIKLDERVFCGNENLKD